MVVSQHVFRNQLKPEISHHFVNNSSTIPTKTMTSTISDDRVMVSRTFYSTSLRFILIWINYKKQKVNSQTVHVLFLKSDLSQVKWNQQNSQLPTLGNINKQTRIIASGLEHTFLLLWLPEYLSWEKFPPQWSAESVVISLVVILCCAPPPHKSPQDCIAVGIFFGISKLKTFAKLKNQKSKISSHVSWAYNTTLSWSWQNKWCHWT